MIAIDYPNNQVVELNQMRVNAGFIIDIRKNSLGDKEIYYLVMLKKKIGSASL